MVLMALPPNVYSSPPVLYLHSRSDATMHSCTRERGNLLLCRDSILALYHPRRA